MQPNSDGMLSFTEEGFQWAWDSTSLTTFVTCPRKYLYSILQGWTSELRSVHLEFGGHYAKALERFHKLRAEGVAHWDAAREVMRLCLIETWERTEDGGAPVDWLHNAKTRDTLIRSIIWYLDQFENDPMETVILPDGRAAVEYSFSVELSEDYLYCGHIDRLVRYGADKDIYVQDQKTSGTTITPKYFQGFSPDTQMTGYTMAGRIIFDLPVSGVIIDAAQIAVGFTRFERGVVARTPSQLEEFREETLAYIAEARRCHEANYYPMRRTSCGNYGGCEFQKVCSMTPKLRANMLAGGFKKRDRWDPLKKR